jgi:hypothetical protein
VSEDEGTKYGQLYAFVERPYSGKNFLICNGFLSGAIELRFDSKASFFESMMVANTTYSRNTTGNGYATATRPLGDNESIWIEAKGYGMGEIMNAFRLALVGEGKGPQMFHISGLIGKEETLSRLRRAITVLG